MSFATAGSLLRRLGTSAVSVLERAEGSGLIMTGKTNAPDFGLLPFTDPEAYGPTLNPWDLSRSAPSNRAAAVSPRPPAPSPWLRRARSLTRREPTGQRSARPSRTRV